MPFCGDLRRAGPAFAQRYPASDPHTVSSPSPFLRFVRRLGRSDRRRLGWTPRSSASSWQGFLVSPGGARRRPECRSCVTCPQGHRTPSRHSQRLATAPLQKDEVVQSLWEAWRGGDKWGKAASCQNPMSNRPVLALSTTRANVRHQGFQGRRVAPAKDACAR
jgi:hypothetical protein